MENYWLMVFGIDEDEEKIESYYKEKYQKALEDMNIAIETLKFSKELIKGLSSVETIDDFELNAQAAIVAQGEAEAKKAEADGISYYNKKVQESASKEVISLRWIEKWDGKLPVYQLGNGSNTLLQIPSGN